MSITRLIPVLALLALGCAEEPPQEESAPIDAPVPGAAFDEVPEDEQPTAESVLVGGWSYGDPETDQLRFDDTGAFTRIEDLELTSLRYEAEGRIGDVIRLRLEDPPSGRVVGWAIVRVSGDTLRIAFAEAALTDWEEAGEEIVALRWRGDEATGN